MNSINKDKQIIAALATPYGKSAVAIIRISGEGSGALVSRRLSRSLEVGKLKVNTFRAEKFTEQLMAVRFVAPHTYTGEETVELYPHGNMTVCDGIIQALISDGARLAERGEFTKRAFLNGKVDLMRCEALADIIDAQTAEQINYGYNRYNCEYKSLQSVEKSLNRALSSVEAALHYSDELEGGEIDEAIEKDVYSEIDINIKKLEKEIDGYESGKIVNEGFKIALIGTPNVGKSTLLNALTDSDRAIVTPIAGTTRDTVIGEYVYNGRKFVVTDTAGLNDSTTDEVERIGIERAYEAANRADAVLYVVTGEQKPKIDKTFARTVIIRNKCDGETDIGIEYERAKNGGAYNISAKNGINITALKQKMYDLCPMDHGCVCNDRQKACVIRCLDALKAAKTEAKKTEGLEIVAALLYEAYSAITELYGEQADEKVISAVFDRFCVGK